MIGTPRAYFFWIQQNLMTHTIHLRPVIEIFLDVLPSSLFTTLEIAEYIQSHKFNVLDFETEFLKLTFQADCNSIDALFKRFLDESENELGVTHFYESHTWIAQYTHEYLIDQHERIDIYKVAYGTGLAFIAFLDRCKIDGIYKTSMPFYIQAVKQMMLDAMNQLVDHDTGVGLDNVMLHKLRESLYKGREQELYGTFGVYAIFRNCTRFWYKLKEHNALRAGT